MKIALNIEGLVLGAKETENDEENSSRARFNPLFYKTVSQLYSDLEKIKSNSFKPTPNPQRPQATNQQANQENINTKLENIAKNKKNLKKSNKNLNKLSKNMKLNKNKTKKPQAKAPETPAPVEAKAKAPILNSNGDIVFSKFDFSVDKSQANSKAFQSNKHNQKNKLSKISDYKKLIEKLKEKNEKLKDFDQETVKQIESKAKWKTTIDKARGLKVKDDVTLLSKSAKRLEKKKNKVKKVWSERQKSVENSKKIKSEKRQKNIDTRKKQKNEKKMKLLKKKGRIITPGF
jgi:hypothetical protein